VLPHNEFGRDPIPVRGVTAVDARPRRRLFLAVDGGNSKTDAILGTADGEVLAYVRGPGTCHQNIGLAETLARLTELVARARSQAGVPAELAVDRAEVYLAGVDLPSEVDLLAGAIGRLGWAGTVHLDNDALALLRAGRDSTWDTVAVVCGAGVNAVGRTADGRTARFPAIGPLSGDWGGGGHLGRLALWHGVRAEDGRGPATGLAKAVAVHFGLSSAEEVGFGVHLGQIDGGRLGELTPMLFELAAAGDAVAGRVVRRLGEELVAMAVTVAGRLSLLDSEFDVLLGGGVLRVGHPGLLEPVTAGVLRAAPKAVLSVITAPPVLGAALSALDAFGAAGPAYAALRSAVTGPPR
jgi:N-acetylglucosamine kinase-like BadF-type ATPase